MSSKIIAASLFEYTLVALGWWLIWRLYFSQSAQKKKEGNAPGDLPYWNINGANFAFACLCAALGWLIASMALGQVLRLLPSPKSDPTLQTIFNGFFSQLSLFLGMAAGAYALRQTTALMLPATTPPPPPTPRPTMTRGRIVQAALITFTITVAVVYPTQWLWEQVLVFCGLPTTKQEVVDVFFRTSSPPRVAALTTMAVLLAPLTEELIFRAGLFRFLRGRAPRGIALLLPALIFASLHVNYTTLNGLISLAPLTALGITFSLAYERTGHIAVPILAHALFNLHTVLFLLLGLGN